MKTVLFFALIVLLTIIGCRKSEIATGIPNCIYQEIAANNGNHNWETGSVEEYLFQNKIVYAFNPDERIIPMPPVLLKMRIVVNFAALVVLEALL